MSIVARPVGSTQVLSWVGKLSVGAALAAYPKVSGEMSSDKIPVSPDTVVARFLLGDPGDPTDEQFRLPEFVFDNTQPAAVAPLQPFQTPGAPIAKKNPLNATDHDVSNQAWAQNAYVTVEVLDVATAALVFAIPATPYKFCLDDAVNSGLGTLTNLPVLVVGIDIGAPQVPITNLNLRITLEIRHTASR
jgi:hypothetical protein